MSQDMTRGIVMVADARKSSHSVGAPSAVTGGGAVSYTLSIWSVIEFDVQGNKVIPLRENYSKTIDQTYSGSKKCALGYCQSNDKEKSTITIKAKFNNLANTPPKVKVYVEIKEQGSTLLGKSNIVSVDTKNKEYTFTINDFVVPIGFYKQNLTFAFKFEDDSGLTGTNNKEVPIYNFPHEPTLPWSKDKNVVNNPWTEVLDLLWEKGWRVFGSIKDKTSKTELATAVTKIVNSKLGLIYESDQGATVFGNSASVFLLSDFLAHRKKSPKSGDTGRRVNCTDCACVVTTFANLLGCELFNVAFGFRGMYNCNKVLTLRSDTDNQRWDYPFSQYYGGKRGGFGYHEICMVEGYQYTSKIYDACLKVNKNVIEHGQDTSRSPLLPADTRFSSKSSYTKKIEKTDAQYYIEWLVYNTPADFNNARLSENLGRRNIR